MSDSECRTALTKSCKANMKQLSKISMADSENIAIAYRDPLPRMVSAFANKFLIARGAVKSPELLVKNGKFPIDHIMKSSMYSYEGIQTPCTSQDPPIANISLAHFLAYVTDPAVPAASINPHFRPQLLSQKDLDDLLGLMDQRSVFPLRVERFASDLHKINMAVESNFMPERSNESSLPSGWLGSDDIDSVFMDIEQLSHERIVPTAVAAQAFLDSRNASIFSRFQFDFKLFDVLDSIYSKNLSTFSADA